MHISTAGYKLGIVSMGTCLSQNNHCSRVSTENVVEFLDVEVANGRESWWFYFGRLRKRTATDQRHSSVTAIWPFHRQRQQTVWRDQQYSQGLAGQHDSLTGCQSFSHPFSLGLCPSISCNDNSNPTSTVYPGGAHEALSKRAGAAASSSGSLWNFVINRNYFVGDTDISLLVS